MTAARNEPPVALRRLLPEPGRLTAVELVGELRPWELASEQRPHVALNMVHTSDGRASVSGRTAPISSPADRQLFHALRTRVDAVMVGAGTLRIERYGRMVPDEGRRTERRAAGLEADPLGIVVSGSSTTREYIQRLGRIIRPKQTRAVLYEDITRKTGQVNTARKRRPAA